MPARYRHTDGSTPPRGALVFWTTSNVAGHIAISAGGGYVWTTDPNGQPGTIDGTFQVNGDVVMSVRDGPAKVDLPRP